MIKTALRPHQPLRVLVVTESFLPQVNGVTNSVRRLLEHLAERGHTAAVVAPTGPATYAGAQVHHVAGVELPMNRGFTVGLATRRRLQEVMVELRPDVVHVAGPFLLGAAAIRAARTLGIPTVSIYQTDLVGFVRRYFLGGAVAPAIERHVRRIHRLTDRTLAPSSASLEQLHSLGVPRVHYWPRGVDAVRFTPDRRDEQLRRDLLQSPEGQAGTRADVLVGYVGRLSKEKGLHQLRAIQDLPGVRLVLVGAGPEEAALRKTLPQASFLGLKEGVELAEIVASLDIFVHPGADETFCQAVQEAQASAVPVVGPDAGGLIDRIDHGINGLRYAAGDPDLLRSAVRRLVGDGSLRRRLGAAAHASVAGRTWEDVNDRLLDHYRDVLSGSTTVETADTPYDLAS
ncbi:glycosyltransferase family 4 protein [Aeromicrobium sp. CF4.19]|uniref:glycosyltransferase family 4 protein n=1 Tax=Aeromicrobium sp. CF4.19 TaxID=3373082 RepID=UPI003EE45171